MPSSTVETSVTPRCNLPNEDESACSLLQQIINFLSQGEKVRGGTSGTQPPWRQVQKGHGDKDYELGEAVWEARGVKGGYNV
jgi:hypothetical protein